MVTALELARHGVSSVLLSAELQFSQGSRAIVFTRRSMEILQQVGVAHRVTENGCLGAVAIQFTAAKKCFGWKHRTIQTIDFFQ